MNVIVLGGRKRLYASMSSPSRRSLRKPLVKERAARSRDGEITGLIKEHTRPVVVTNNGGQCNPFNRRAPVVTLGRRCPCATVFELRFRNIQLWGIASFVCIPLSSSSDSYHVSCASSPSRPCSEDWSPCESGWLQVGSRAWLVVDALGRAFFRRP